MAPRGALPIRDGPRPPTPSQRHRQDLQEQQRAADQDLLKWLHSKLRFTDGQALLLQRFSLWRVEYQRDSRLEDFLEHRGDFSTHPDVQEFLGGFRGDGARRAAALPGFLAQMRAFLLRTQLREDMQRFDPQEQARIDGTQAFIEKVFVDMRRGRSPTMAVPWEARLIALQEYSLHLHLQRPPLSLEQAVPTRPFDPAAAPQVQAFLDTLAPDDLVRTALVSALNVLHRRHFNDPGDSLLRSGDLATIDKFLELKPEHKELHKLLTAARLRRIAAYLAKVPGQPALADLAHEEQALQGVPHLARDTSLSMEVIELSLKSVRRALARAVLPQTGGAARDRPLLDRLSAQLGPDNDGLRCSFSEWLLAEEAPGGLDSVLAWRGDFATDPRVGRFIQSWPQGEPPDAEQVVDMLDEARAPVHHEDVMNLLHESDRDAWNALQECRVRITQAYCDGLDAHAAAPLPTVWTQRLSALAEFALFHGRTALTEVMPDAFDPMNDDQVLGFLNSLQPDDPLRQEFLPGLKVLLHRDPLDPGDAGLRLEDREAIALYAASLPDDPHGHGARLSAILRTIATALNTADEQPQPFLMEAATDAGVRASLEPLLSLLEFQEEEVTGALKALGATAVAVAGPLNRFGSVDPVPGASPWLEGSVNWATPNIGSPGFGGSPGGDSAGFAWLYSDLFSARPPSPAAGAAGPADVQRADAPASNLSEQAAASGTTLAMSARQRGKRPAKEPGEPAATKRRPLLAKAPLPAAPTGPLAASQGPLWTLPKELPPLAPSTAKRINAVRSHFSRWLLDHGKRFEDLLLHRGDYKQMPECVEYLASTSGAGVTNERLNGLLSLDRLAACVAQAKEQLATRHPTEAALIRECRQRARRLYLGGSRGSADSLPSEWESRLLALTELALSMGQEDPPRSLSRWLKSDSGQLDRDIPGVLKNFPQDSVTGPDLLREALNLARGRDLNDPGDLGSRAEDIETVASYEQITSAATHAGSSGGSLYRRHAAALRTYAQASAAAGAPSINEAAHDQASQEAAAQRFGGGSVLTAALRSLRSMQYT